MAEVDPFVAPIPKAFREDREVRDFMEYFIQWAHDMYERVGGPDDAITDIESGELYEPGIQTDNNAELVEGLEVDTELGLPAVNDESVGELEVDESLAPIVHDMLERVRELEIDAELWVRQEVEEVSEDWFLEMAKGNKPGHLSVGKFGEAPSGIQTSATDIWSRADSTPTQQIWLAPTAARIHTIASDSAQDVSGGTGTTSVEVFYLPDWSTAETSEIVSGNINAGIAMSSAAVMINRMIASPQSTGTGPGPNKGTITATAATDGTITAVIRPEEGQTEQAIYGFPSGYTAYIDRWAGGIDKATGAAASVDFRIRFNPNPDVQTLCFQRKRDASAQSNGNTGFEKKFKHDNSYAGPGIIKIQAIASSADTDGYSEFDLTLVQDGF